MPSPLPPPTVIREVSLTELAANPNHWLLEDAPWVVRGLGASWPLVKAAQNSNAEAAALLKDHDSGHGITAFLCEAEHRGRFFYNEALDGFNFVQVKTRLSQVVDKLIALVDTPDPAGLYVGSTQLAGWLPGLGESLSLPFELNNPLVSLWLGNASRIAAHFDYPRNLACCVMGRRKFTVFPPEQVGNLYIGPWDLTPAGQPISLVDFHDPDIHRFPRFPAAWQAATMTELEPGDAIYLPGMWWHHVEGIESINGLINYWWSETPPVYGSPADVFQHGLLSIKQLPAAQKRAWQALFDQYLFAEDDEHLQHITPSQRGTLDAIDETAARQLRAELINRLKR